MKKLAREPLLHFFLAGALIFGAYGALNRDEGGRQTILVTSGQIANLAAGFSKVWHRSPTQMELKDLVDSQVKEEILSREAIKLGLDQDDTIIRRRLQQKMEFIVEDFAATSEPTDSELAEYFAHHPEQFAKEQSFTFRQVTLRPEKRGERIAADAAALLAQLKRQPHSNIDELGDTVLLPAELVQEPRQAVEAQFGQTFAAELGRIETGVWSGPIASGFGVHLVLLTERTHSGTEPLENVRAEVKRELMNARRIAANHKFLDNLIARYQVEIEASPLRLASAEHPVAN